MTLIAPSKGREEMLLTDENNGARRSGSLDCLAGQSECIQPTRHRYIRFLSARTGEREM